MLVSGKALHGFNEVTAYNFTPFLPLGRQGRAIIIVHSQVIT